MKIGILTFHYANNYGALLQTYALSTTLKNLGFDPIIINRVPISMADTFASETLFVKIKIKIGLLIQKHFQNSFYHFRRDFLPNISKPINSNELIDFVNQFDAVIVGSDQVWRIEYTKGLGLNNFLDFVPDNIKKISYAASFGNDTFDGDEGISKKVKQLLLRFSAISVREDSGVKICNDIFEINAIHLLDPTLLLNQSDYQVIIGKCKIKEEKFVAKYFLDKTSNKIHLVNIFRESDIDYSLKEDKFNLEKFYYPIFSFWLRGIKEAEFVITDSYHGAVFSILFNKQFICIANNSRGLTRMTSLLKKFNIEDRLVFDVDNFNLNLTSCKIDYNVVNKIINEERVKAIDFLMNSIKS